MIARPLPPGSVCIDTDAVLTSDDAERLALVDRPGPRLSAVGRYLSELSPGELAAIQSKGLGVFGYAHPRGVLSAAGGTLAGQSHAAMAKALGLPHGMHLVYDLESWSGDAIGDVNAWSVEIRSAGFIPALYVGWAQDPLTPDELYTLSPTLYLKSGSDVPDVAHCGYAVVQFALDSMLAGVLVDLESVIGDREGRTLIAAFASVADDTPTLPGRKISSRSMPAVKG